MDDFFGGEANMRRSSSSRGVTFPVINTSISIIAGATILGFLILGFLRKDGCSKSLLLVSSCSLIIIT